MPITTITTQTIPTAKAQIDAAAPDKAVETGSGAGAATGHISPDFGAFFVTENSCKTNFLFDLGVSLDFLKFSLKFCVIIFISLYIMI